MIEKDKKISESSNHIDFIPAIIIEEKDDGSSLEGFLKLFICNEQDT